MKRNILSLYEDDLKKYDEDNREKASVIFKTIPEQLGNHNSHFKFSMEAYADRSHFKLYMGDTGLLITQIMKNSEETTDDLYKAIIFDKLGINFGMIIENMVAQMLRANGYDLYFHEFMYGIEEMTKEKNMKLIFFW